MHLIKRNNKQTRQTIEGNWWIEKREIINVPLLEEKQKELQDIRKSKMEGKLIRSRAKWMFEGENPSNYFCNLENRNYV